MNLHTVETFTRGLQRAIDHSTPMAISPLSNHFLIVVSREIKLWESSVSMSGLTSSKEEKSFIEFRESWAITFPSSVIFDCVIIGKNP